MKAELAANTLKNLLRQNINVEVTVEQETRTYPVALVPGETRNEIITKLITTIKTKVPNDSKITHISDLLAMTEFKEIDGTYKQVSTLSDAQKAELIEELSLVVNALIIE